MRILIADAMSDKAVEILKSNGLEVDVKTDMSKEEFKATIGEYDGLIVRSAAKVTRDIIEQGGEFPQGSMVGVQAVREFDGYDRASRLTMLLNEFDALFNKSSTG